MRKLFVSAALAAVVGAHGQGPMTLSDAERIALENAFSIRSAKAGFEKASQQTRQARGALGWKLTFEGNYTRFDQRSQFGTTAAGDPILGSIDNKTLSMTVSYPLDIAGVGRRGIRGAQWNERAAAATIDAETSGIKNAVRSGYYGVLRAADLLKVVVEARDAARDRLAKARVRFEAGAIAKFDVLRFETESTRAEADVINATNGLRLAKNALNNTLGRPIDTEFDPVEVDQMSRAVAEPDRYIAVALKTRPDLRSAEDRTKFLNFISETERRGTLPSLSLSATHTRTLDPSVNQRDKSTTATAFLSFPIFDSGITRARVAAAKEDERQAQLAVEQIGLAVGLQVRQALVRLENAQQTLEVARKTVEQASEALRIAEVRYEAGEGILLDITDAQLSLTQAKQAVVAARYDYLAAYADLQFAVGTDDLDAALGGSR
ncbi:MAG TPA: TolC family protein [Fimbriimonadaceae bacterium]|nr:TolC family protein [Fimbriimonadaceae bacterium]